MKPLNPLNPPLTNQRVTIDKPHEPFGQHVDIVTPLGNGIPGTQKLRVNGTGNIITENFNIKKNWP